MVPNLGTGSCLASDLKHLHAAALQTAAYSGLNAVPADHTVLQVCALDILGMEVFKCMTSFLYQCM